MAKKIKLNSKGTAKGLAISAGAGVAGGAAAGGLAYKFFGKHTEAKEVQISWDNLNDDLLFQAISKKWSSSANGADLNTREGWIQMITNLRNNGQPTLAQNATNDLFDVTAMSQDGISFSGFLNKEQLADYVSGQDVSDSMRVSVSEYAKSAFSAKWGMPYNASDADYAKLIYARNDPQVTQDLMNDRLMIKTWSGEGLSEADLDSRLNNINSVSSHNYDVSNMTIEEKCNALLDWRKDNHPTVFEDGYTADVLTKAVRNEGYYSSGDVMEHADAVIAGKWVNAYDYYSNLESMRDNVDVDVNDFIESLGSSPELVDANSVIINNRQGMLQNAIEDKYNLPDGSVDVNTLDTSVVDQVPEDSKQAFIDNVVNSGAYIRDQNLPIPQDAQDMAVRTGVREIVEGWINNGDTTVVEQTVGSLGLQEISGISGIGTVITFGIVFGLWKHRMHKLQKVFDEANAQVAELEAKMDAQDNSLVNTKTLKRK